MSYHLVSKSFRMVGIERRCLFKDFKIAFPEARADFNDGMKQLSDQGNADTELIFYARSQEDVHPERKEQFYF